MQEIQFGRLTLANVKERSAVQNHVAGAKLGKAEDIYTEYEKYKEQLEGAQGAENGGQQTDLTVSPSDLEAMINETVQEFNEYYAVINESSDTTQNDNQPNEDNKNKVQPKEFGGFMA